MINDVYKFNEHKVKYQSESSFKKKISKPVISNKTSNNIPQQVKSSKAPRSLGMDKLFALKYKTSN